MLAYTLFGQDFQYQDIAVVGLLIVLEGVLSIDNALVLGLLAKRLPKSQQARALTYGLVGAFIFRLIAVATASYLLHWRFVKLLGGGYLIYVAVRHLFFESKEEVDETIVVDESGRPVLLQAETGLPLTPEQEEVEIEERVLFNLDRRQVKFWSTIGVIELTDIAFAVDSIFAAIALVGSPPPGHPPGAVHPKLWVVLTGGMLGVVLMRVAAAVFIKLLQRFPRFEVSAYLLVAVIGTKLLVDWMMNTPDHPHRLDFHSIGRPEFWVFWILMLICFGLGFLPPKSQSKEPQ